MKILHVLDHSLPIQDGYSYRTEGILRAQKQLGWQTKQITSAKHMTASEEEAAGDFYYYRTKPSGLALARFPVFNQVAVASTLRKRVEQVVSQWRPDVLHAHSPSLTGLACIGVAKACRLPFAYEVRAFWEDAAVDHGTCSAGGVRYRLTAATEAYVLKHADAVTTICEGLKKELIRRGTPATKVTVVPNGVEISESRERLIGSLELPQALGLDKKFVVGFMGSFYAWEGLDVLLRAYKRRERDLANVRLLLVGGGREVANLKRQTAELGLSGRVVFTGWVPHEQVHEYYAVMDLLCFPRKRIRLTELVTPLKPLEAMAHGKVCVASDVGGHKELIANGVNGFLFRADDETHLAEVIVRLQSKGDDFAAVERSSKLFVQRDRTWLASAKKYEEVYKSIVRDPL